MEKKTVGAFIALLRKEKGMTQKELAELLNVSDKAVSRWERDESAPDISLLLPLADIFEVTCDELLCGERIRTKQKASLEGKEKIFQIGTVISIGMIVAGILSAAALNFLWNNGTIAFCSAVIFLIAAEICQIVFYYIAKPAGGDSDSRKIRDTTLKITYAVAVAAAFCLPLLLFGRVDLLDVYRKNAGIAEAENGNIEGLNHAAFYIASGIAAKVWILYGGAFGVAAAILSVLADSILKRKENAAMQVRMKYALALIAALLITAGFAAGFSVYGKEWYVEGKVYESFEEFGAYMEKVPKDMWTGKVELRRKDKNFIERIYDEDGTFLYEYKPFNEDPVKITYGKNQRLPITVYTKEDYEKAAEKVKDKMWIFLLVGAVECMLAAGIYFRRVH